MDKKDKAVSTSIFELIKTSERECKDKDMLIQGVSRMMGAYINESFIVSERCSNCRHYSVKTDADKTPICLILEDAYESVKAYLQNDIPLG